MLPDIWQKQLSFKDSLPHKLDVWCQSVADFTEHVDFFSTLLSTDEAQKAQQFVFAKDQIRYTICRGFLRCLLAHYLQMSAQELVFDYNSQEKPEIINTQHLFFNLSHTQDYFLIGVSSLFPIGVDIEQYANIDILNIAQNFFSTRECQALINLQQDKQLELFYTLWTRKEALVKATGEGLTEKALKQIEVLTEIGVQVKKNQFFIRSIQVAENHAAAVACATDWQEDAIHYFNFTGNILRNILSL